MPEISQRDLDALVSIQSLYTKALANPEAREHVLRAAKLTDPTIVNELDTADRYIKPVKDELSAAKAEIADFRKEWLADKAEREKAEQAAKFENEWNAQANNLRRKGYMDDAIVKIQALAAQKGIVDLEDAAAIYDRDAPAPSVQSSRFSALTVSEADLRDTTDEYMKALFTGQGNAPGAQRKQIALALNESRAR
jgi:hypothetical protein